ncbi:WD repeat-containing protein on Y chromosome [Thrips palmi]|uniref:WD repeat-containing protein on Y chromosome n=1 Tax=Thrips palmi TaxID=161013 RepID=A0A6P9ANC7_THRPL|nr:WD repeat-containing protein on Y chromosome [Thrips palmi]
MSFTTDGAFLGVPTHTDNGSSGGSAGHKRSPRSRKKSTRLMKETKERVSLASRLDKDQIEAIHDMFKGKLHLDPDRPRLMGSEFELTKLHHNELRDLLCNAFGITMGDDEFHVIFLKCKQRSVRSPTGSYCRQMDTNRSGSITWDEVVSHLLVIRSPHRNPIIRITYWPEVSADRSFNYLQGRFVSASHDGAVQYWTMDLKRERLVQSKTVLLKVRPTWVTDLVCMPDVNMMCTSSTERELRFYDTRAGKWELRVLVSGLDKPVVTMYYQMSARAEDESTLILGDTGGSVRTFNFNSVQCGPFRQHVGKEATHVLFRDLCKDGLPGLRVAHFPRVHSNWVRQVYYYASLQSILSCAACPRPSLFMCDAAGTKNQYEYNVPSGVYCFCASEETHMIATGGPDSVLRVWNPFVCDKPSAQLIGHHAAIVAIVIQGTKMFSLDAAKCVRVWDGRIHSCIQAYSAMMDNNRLPYATYYHPLSRVWMVAGRDIQLIQLCAQLNPDRSDGHTHTAPVTCVIYNTLFKCVVTTGMDSCIMVWDPWRGSRTRLVKQAHSLVRYGRDEPVEITAACFDPPQQLLLTGAANGTLKVWNFNTGICVRNMTIGSNGEVTAVMWVPMRILAVGWNMRVVEWADGGASLRGKSWDLKHTSHVLCADTRPPDALATATDNGELIMWRLETGQPYGRYRVDEPVHKSGMSHYVETEVKPPRYWTPVHMPRSTGAQGRPPRVHQLRFLRARPVTRGVASLVVALSTGYVQMWSHHPVGGYLTHFLAVHTVADYVLSMETDPECNFLFTGHSVGYIKIWLMSNYCYPNGRNKPLFMPALRKQFPFLFRDRIPGRAKRAVKAQALPMLLSSVRAHLQPVTFLQYCPDNKILFSSSADYSVRLWSLSGEYIATLGTALPWPQLSPDLEWDPGDEPPRIPADLKRVSSSTSFKVMRRGQVEWLTPTVLDRAVRAKKMQSLRPITADDLFPGTYGQRLYKPLMGHCYELPDKAIGCTPTVALETDLPKIPVFHHIKTIEEQDVSRPPTPDCVRAVRTFRMSSTSSSLPVLPRRQASQFRR